MRWNSKQPMNDKTRWETIENFIEIRMKHTVTEKEKKNYGS